MYTTVFPALQNEITVWRPFQGIIPEKLYMFLVDQRSVNGDTTRNPFYYAVCNILYFSVRINGEQYAGNDEH